VLNWFLDFNCFNLVLVFKKIIQFDIYCQFWPNSVKINVTC